MKLKRRPVQTGETIQILLSDGQHAIVDVIDADLAQLNWCGRRIGRTGYAHRKVRGRAAAITLHREIGLRMFGELTGFQVDHIDQNGLNCRRENLRKSTHSQNQHNRRRQSNNTSGFKGVSWNKSHEKWEVMIRLNNQPMHLGSYRDLELAAFVYEEAAHRLHGEFASRACL